ncbi:T9SS type A sorting domain-containing protein [uncultured Arcticibacterium sp.]|uniref:T9SS type A sorting domain-containing protein n=1 Tax=uncultured Arcticibacterium sp. TaxID=2173042 RepID=UPI0030F71E18
MKLRLLFLLSFISVFTFGQIKITNFTNTSESLSWDFENVSVGEYLYLKSRKPGDSQFEIWKFKNNKVEEIIKMQAESIRLYAGELNEEELFIGTDKGLFVLNVAETDPVYIGDLENATNKQAHFTLGNTYLTDKNSITTISRSHELTKKSVSGVNLTFQTFKEQLFVLDQVIGNELDLLSIYDGHTMTPFATGMNVSIVYKSDNNLIYTDYKDSKQGYYFLNSNFESSYLGDSWFRTTDSFLYTRNADNMDLVDMLTGEILYRHPINQNLQYSTTVNGKHIFYEYDVENERTTNYHIIEGGSEEVVDIPKHFNALNTTYLNDKGILGKLSYQLDGQNRTKFSFFNLESKSFQEILDVSGSAYSTGFDDVILLDVNQLGKDREWQYWSLSMEKPLKAFKYAGEGQFSYPIFSNAIYTKSAEGGYGIYKIEDGKLKEPFFFKDYPLFNPEWMPKNRDKLFYKKLSPETGFEIGGFTVDGLEDYDEIAEGEEGIFHDGYEPRIFRHLNDYYILAHTTNDGWQVWNLDAEVEVSLGLSETDLVVFPNPSTDKLNIKMDNEFATYSLFSSDGRKVKSANFEKGESAIDVSSLQHGLYFIKLKVGDKTVVKRFLKK